MNDTGRQGRFPSHGVGPKRLWQYARARGRRLRWAVDQLAPQRAAQAVSRSLGFDRPPFAGAAPLTDFDGALSSDLLPATFLHWWHIGRHRGERLHPTFDADRYARDNPDVRVDGYEPFAHARLFGQAEHRLGPAPPLPPAPTLADLLAMPPLPVSTLDETVDIIVPVYRGLDDVLRCLGAVLTARDPQPHRLVVVDDATPEPAISAALDALAERGLISLLRQPSNRGFVAAVNRGMADANGRHVVLLNADTAVHGRWLTRLLRTLTGAPRVGTVTPMSNAATILSYPIRLRDNALLSPTAAAEWDDHLQRLALPPIEIPTSVGFCMAIHASCHDQIGRFDEATFGQGYGEENDFSRRAIRAGWTNVAACDVFVWHRGGGSFGAEKAARVNAAQVALERLHPGYRAAVHRFIRHDPIAPVRQALDCARVAAMATPRNLCVGDFAAEPALHPHAVGPGFSLQVVPDISPFIGLWRLVPAHGDALPNLPRLASSMSQRELGTLLSLLRIDTVEGSPSHPVTQALQRALA